MRYQGYLIYPQVFMVLFSLIYFFVRVIKALKAKRVNWFREMILAILLLYLLELINVTLFPVFVDIGDKFSIFPISYETRNSPIFVNINPFYYGFIGASAYTMIINIIGNIFIMLPYTILLPCAFRRMRKWKMAIGTAALTSICIELLQLLWQFTMLNPTRKTDIIDVILNLIGAVIGFALYCFVFSKVPITKFFVYKSDQGIRSAPVKNQ